MENVASTYIHCMKSLQLRLTLCDHMDRRSLGSFVHGLPQARRVEWVAISFPRDLPYPGIEPESLKSPELAGRFFTASAIWEALCIHDQV